MLAYDPNQDAYRILGAHPDDSAEEIEQAYRRAALTWHPDKCPAPDASERFHAVQEAGRILRSKRMRADYDRLRAFHLGPEAMRERRSRFTQKAQPPPSYQPLTSPPAWLAEKVNIHFDAVLVSLEMPVPEKRRGRIPHYLAFICLGMAIWSRSPLVASLAVVFWLYSRVAARPPHHGRLTWAKIAPGRKEAEYHALDRRASHYEQLTVPFRNLSVAVVADRAYYQVQINGFPHGAVPVLHRTSDLREANRCAREAADWLQISAVKAA